MAGKVSQRYNKILSSDNLLVVNIPNQPLHYDGVKLKNRIKIPLWIELKCLQVHLRFGQDLTFDLSESSLKTTLLIFVWTFSLLVSS